MADTWYPITTAPRDGMPLLLALDDGTRVVGYWCSSYTEWLDNLSDVILDPPTHWAPIPALPQTR